MNREEHLRCEYCGGEILSSDSILDEKGDALMVGEWVLKYAWK